MSNQTIYIVMGISVALIVVIGIVYYIMSKKMQKSEYKQIQKLQKGTKTSTFSAEVIYQKYCMGAPLCRQEKMWDDLGLVLPRNMMANWCIKIS